MWPHTFGSVYSAKSENVFRKNAIIMPLYQLVLLFVFFVGFAAILQVPGLQGPDADLSLLKLSKQSFNPWFVGIIGGAGVLTAIVPGSMILMASATLISKNIYKVFVPSATEKQVAVLAKYLVPVVALFAVFFTFNGGSTLVTLLLMGYSLVTQLFPTLVFSLMKKNFVTKQGAFAGILTGVATVTYVTISNTTIGSLFPALPQYIKDLNIGVIGLVVNLVFLVVVSLLTKNIAVQSKKEIVA
jgi:SSS family solute:Na+ symporter